MTPFSDVPEKPGWLKTMYPWQQKSVIVNGRRMAYLDEGDPSARAVILCHGNPTWSFLYRDFISPLVDAGYRVIAPDCIGSGYSEKPPLDASYSLAHHVADLVALIDSLGFRGFAVVGQDWGGPQGTGAALQRVDRLAALVLMNTWLFTEQSGPFHGSPLPWTTWHAPLIGQLFMKRFKVLSHRGVRAVSQRQMHEDEVRGYTHVYDAPESEGVTLVWPRSIPARVGDRGWSDMKAIQDQLGALQKTPVQFLWAPGDAVFPLEYQKRLKELIPHAEGPIVFDKAAHFLQDDRGPDIVKEIVAFLDRTVGNQP